MIKNKKLILSLILFIIVISILGIPFTKWGFKNDDWSNLYNCNIKNFKDIFKFFTQGNIECLYNPSNTDNTVKMQGFLQGLFRPISFIYYLPQYFLLKTNSYGYFLVTICFHALNTIILFNLFSLFIPIFFSFIGALFFAFHPSLWNWLGWISAQTYFIELFVLLLSIIFLKKYIDSKKRIFYLFSCLLFASNIFLKEQSIFFPLWSIFAIYLYEKIQNPNNSIANSIKLSLGYWSILFLYLMARISLFPFNANTGTLNFELTLTSFLNRFKDRFFDFVTYCSDFFYLSWMPQKHQFIKGSLILLSISIILYLFIKNNKKTYLIFILFSIILFSWPAILIQYQPRYIYISTSFLILGIIILFQYANVSFYKNKILQISTALPIMFLALFLYNKLSHREKMLNHITTSFKNLIQDTHIKNQIENNKPLCFIALPPYWFDMGTSQALWFLTNNNSYHVYQFNTKVNEQNRHSYRKIPIFEKNYLKVYPKNYGFKIKSLNSEKLSFKTKQKNKTKIKIPKKYLDEKPIFITWNYKKADFKIINKNIG